MLKVACKVGGLLWRFIAGGLRRPGGVAETLAADLARLAAKQSEGADGQD